MRIEECRENVKQNEANLSEEKAANEGENGGESKT
jgi:hypothetical protein